MEKLSKFQHVFVEPDNNDSVGVRSLRICHNTSQPGSEFKIQIYNIFGEEIDKEYIYIDMFGFDFLRSVFEEFLFTLDINHFCNPYKTEAIERVFYKLGEIKSDLIRNEVTELLEKRLANLYITCLCEENSINYLKVSESKSKDSEEYKKAYWDLIFENKEKIIDFYDALIWYVWEHKSFRGYEGSRFLNIWGL